MKGKNILADGIGRVDDAVLERFDKLEAELCEKKNKKMPFPWFQTVAACVALVLIATVVIARAVRNDGQPPESLPPLGSQSGSPLESTPNESTPNESTPNESTPNESSSDRNEPQPVPEEVIIKAYYDSLPESYRKQNSIDTVGIWKYLGEYNGVYVADFYNGMPKLTAQSKEMIGGIIFTYANIERTLFAYFDGEIYTLAEAYEGSLIDYGDLCVIRSLRNNGYPDERLGDPDYSDEHTEGLGFTLNGDGVTYTVTSYAGSEQNIVIPEIYKGCYVTAIGDEAFAYSGDTVRTAELPNSIEHIGDRAFYYSYLSYVTVPAGVTYIGEDAFVSEHLISISYRGTPKMWREIGANVKWDATRGSERFIVYCEGGKVVNEDVFPSYDESTEKILEEALSAYASQYRYPSAMMSKTSHNWQYYLGEYNGKHVISVHSLYQGKLRRSENIHIRDEGAVFVIPWGVEIYVYENGKLTFLTKAYGDGDIDGGELLDIIQSWIDSGEFIIWS